MKFVFFFCVLLFFSFSPKKEFEILLNLETDVEYWQEFYMMMEFNFPFMPQELLGMEVEHKMMNEYSINWLEDDQYDIAVATSDWEFTWLDTNSLSAALFDQLDFFETVEEVLEDMGYNIIVTKSGEIIQISQLEELVSKIRMLNNTQSNDIELELMGINDLFDERFFNETIRMSFGMYPGHPVSIGDSWGGYWSADAQNEMDFEMKYTLTGVDENYFYISVIGIINEVQPEEENPMLSGLHMSIEGELEGYYILDRKSGWVKEAEIFQFAEMNMEMNFPGEEELLEIKASTSNLTKISGGVVN